jgi:hypothetical protein
MPFSSLILCPLLSLQDPGGNDSFLKLLDRKISKAPFFEDQLDSLVEKYRKSNNTDDEHFRTFHVFEVETGNGYIFSAGSFAATNSYVALAKGSTYEVNVLPRDGYFLDEDCFPMSAFMDGNSLIVSGRLNDYSNYGSSYVVRYAKEKNGWRLKQFQHGGFEGEATIFRKHGSSWTARAEGRAYPKHLGVPHAGARVHMSRTYLYQNGKLQPSHDKLISCPMATLDALVQAGIKREWTRVRNLCSSASAAQKFKLVSKDFGNEKLSTGCDLDESILYADSFNVKFTFRQLKGQWKLFQVRHGIESN